MTFDRREWIKACAVTGILAQTARSTADERSASPQASPSESPRPWDVIDTNLSLFRWPSRRLPLDTTSDLGGKLQSLAIAEGWAGSLEGLLHRDLAAVNARLAEACHATNGVRLIPFGAINPALPDWEEDLRRCHEQHHMPGIRLHPNYHGYRLDDPRLERLLHLAAERQMLVQLAVAMEDTRTQPSLLQVPDVDLTPLPRLVAKVPGARLMLLNYRPKAIEVERLAPLPGVSFDIARVEATDGIARLIDAVSPDRVMFGTHAPFLIIEAALIKVYESNLKPPHVDQLLASNAKRWLT